MAASAFSLSQSLLSRSNQCNSSIGTNLDGASFVSSTRPSFSSRTCTRRWSVKSSRSAVKAAAVKIPEETDETLVEKSVNTIRFLAIDAVEKANSGHPGLPMGCAPIGHVLYDEVMRYNPKNPYWFNRDRFVLSAGHGCMLQYALLHLAAFDSVKVLHLFYYLIFEFSSSFSGVIVILKWVY